MPRIFLSGQKVAIFRQIWNYPVKTGADYPSCKKADPVPSRLHFKKNPEIKCSGQGLSACRSWSYSITFFPVTCNKKD
jgi:hypothetical protein